MGRPRPEASGAVPSPGPERRNVALHLLPPALFLVCAFAWSLAIPPFESPDEIGHARYVNYLREHGRLPIAGSGAPGEAHQPPLYYAMAAAVGTAAGWEPISVSSERNPRFVWYGGSGAAKYLHPAHERPALTGSASTLHRLRLLSVLLGSGAVLAIGLLARAAGMAGPGCCLVASLAAFTPQFTFVSGSLNNDSLANLAGAMCLALLAAGMAAPRTPIWGAAGLAAGAGLLAKFSTLTMLPCGPLAAILSPSRGRGGRLRAAGWFLLPALLLPAPLLLSNLLRWGDPFGAAAQIETLPQLVDRKSLLSTYFLVEFPRVMLRSFWGTFGWMSLPMPRPIDLAFAALTAAGLAGLVLAWRRGAAGPIHGMLSAAVAAQIGQVVVYNLTFTQAQGRFLFPVMGAAALLLGTGLGELWRRGGGPSLSPATAAGLAVLMAACNQGLLWLWVAPAYAAPPG